MDCSQCRSRKPNAVSCCPQVSTDQRKVAGLHCHIRSRAECDTKIRLRQRSRVVDTLADHGDSMPGVLQSDYLGDLLLWQDVGDDVINPDFGGGGSGRGFVITSQ